MKLSEYLFLVASLLFSSIATSADLDVKDRNTIEVLCKQLLADYAIYRDHLDADGFANTFSQDGTLLIGTNTYHGRQEIRKNITDRPHPGNAHMIMFTTTQITPISATEASSISSALILNGNQPVAAGDKPIQMYGISVANEYRTNFKLTDGGWKISHLEFSTVFRGPGYVQ
ncbi:MAG: nuclear transport factor 2 family protein [Arenicellaceae bacterium]|nr:nuclear transport factor 2 family protein [Arenicellaceae bacterium]